MIARQIVRNFMTSTVKRSGHGPEGFPGANVPFDINNRYKLTAVFIFFLGSGFSIPYLMVRHQILK